jgi:restriction endonuclease S subunit
MAENGFLYVTSKNIRPFKFALSERLYVSERDHREIYARCDVRQGDVLLTKDGVNTGNAVVNPLAEEFSLLSSVALLRPSYSLLNATFLCQFLNSASGRAQTVGAMDGLAIRRLTLAKIQELAVPVPPLAEQRKIAAILSSVDEAIEATQAVIDQLEIVKKAMMAELLTRGLPGRHTRFKQTEIGEVPEEWEVLPLSDLAFVQTGVAKGKMIDNGVELPYLRVANVQDGRVDLAEVKTILVDPSFVARYALMSGDVLFTEGGDADKLGRGCVWRAEISPCLHQNHVFAVRTNKDRLVPEYLAYWASSSRGKAYFLECAKQTTNLASINSTQLKAFPVPLAPYEEQAAIVSTLRALDERTTSEGGVLFRLQALKSALMSVLLTGEVRVRPDEPGDLPTAAAPVSSPP